MKGTELSGGIQTGHRCQVEIAFGNPVCYSYKHGNENEMAFAQNENSAMLKIIFGEVDNAVYHPPTYFDNQYEDEWITDPLTVAMIKDIDKSDVIGTHLIQSPVLGPISTKEISGGVKTLILMAFDESRRIFNASACGDNCVKWIVELGKRKDLTINLHHVMDFSSVPKFDAVMPNTGVVIHSYGEYLEEALQIKER